MEWCLAHVLERKRTVGKLQVGVVNGRPLRRVEAFVHGEGLPCLQIRVTIALQSPLIVFSGSPDKPLDHLVTFHGSEGSSDIFYCTNKAEVVCKGRHFSRTKHTDVLLYSR